MILLDECSTETGQKTFSRIFLDPARCHANEQLLKACTVRFNGFDRTVAQDSRVVVVVVVVAAASRRKDSAS